MRTNSGKGDSSNNRGNPALEEVEQARGTSGEAIVGHKKAKTTPDRTRAPDNSGTR